MRLIHTKILCSCLIETRAMNRKKAQEPSSITIVVIES